VNNSIRTSAFLACLTVCATSLCAANVPGHDVDPINAPLFSKPGQTRLALALGQKGQGAHAHGGLAISPNLAVVGSVAYAKQANCNSCTISERQHIEAGVAYYSPLLANGFAREVIAGLGTGNFRMSGSQWKWDPQPDELRVTKGSYNQAYLQANVGKRDKWIDWAGSLRVAAYRITGFSLKNGEDQLLDAPQKHWGLYLEPAAIFRFGYREVKIDNQIGLSLPLVQADEVDNNVLWASLGVGVDLFGK
jgi:hypothetical protein